jgi:hypothetical protein
MSLLLLKKEKEFPEECLLKKKAESLQTLPMALLMENFSISTLDDPGKSHPTDGFVKSSRCQARKN